jgi:isochorismate synthase
MPALASSAKGFVFSPFWKGHDASFCFLKGDFHTDTMGRMHRVPGVPDSAPIARFDKAFSRFEHPLSPGPCWFIGTPYSSGLDVAQDIFCEWVQKAVQEIHRDTFTKVVLSRPAEVELAGSFEPQALFYELCRAYQNAFVSLVALPGVGTWIGATPELLLSLDNRQLATVSLAGTKSFQAELNGQNIIWGKKEQVEQEIVSDYIRACFESHGIYDFFEHPLETVRIGNLLHLQTKFTRHLQTTTPEEITSFLTSLHPTPAVCGVPKEQALKFIEANEICKRQYYSGYLGPVDFNDCTRLYVNLRCLQLHEDTATLYAGCGITKDSVPEKEWLETQLKLGALLKYLKVEYSGLASEEILSTSALLR